MFICSSIHLLIYPHTLLSHFLTNRHLCSNEWHPVTWHAKMEDGNSWNQLVAAPRMNLNLNLHFFLTGTSTSTSTFNSPGSGSEPEPEPEPDFYPGSAEGRSQCTRPRQPPQGANRNPPPPPHPSPTPPSSPIPAPTSNPSFTPSSIHILLHTHPASL